MKKMILAAAVLSLGMGTAAIAQTSATAPAGATTQTVLIDIENGAVVQPFNLPAEQLRGRDLVDGDGVHLGRILRVLGENATVPTNLVVALADSDVTVITPIERFAIENGAITIQATAEELSALPAYTN